MSNYDSNSTLFGSKPSSYNGFDFTKSGTGNKVNLPQANTKAKFNPFSDQMSSGYQKAGAFASDWASGGSGGTGGAFTQAGVALAPFTFGISIPVSMALDAIVGSNMGDKAYGKAQKQAREYWAGAQTEMNQLKLQQKQQRGYADAQIGASGASFNSGSINAYRNEQMKQQDLDFSRMFDQYAQNYVQIRRSGGSGGKF